MAKARETLKPSMTVEWKGQNTHASTNQRILSGKGHRNERLSRLVSKINMLNAGFTFSVIVLQLHVKAYWTTYAIYSLSLKGYFKVN